MTIEEADDLAKAMFGQFAYVEANEQESDPGKRFFIKMGIAGKSFEQCFEKAMDTMEVSNAIKKNVKVG
jgi:hypothetical protein